MYLFLSSDDCTSIHPGNNAWDFTVELNLHLQGQWECALTEIDYKGSPSELYVYSDLCADSFVTGKYLPVLRIVKKPTNFKKPYFIPVGQEFLNRIRVYIRTAEGQIPSFQPKRLRCTLRLRHVCN